MDALDEGMAELYVDEDYVNYPNCQLPVREFRRGTDPTEYMEAIQRRLKSLVERKKKAENKKQQTSRKVFWTIQYSGTHAKEERGPCLTV